MCEEQSNRMIYVVFDDWFFCLQRYNRSVKESRTLVNVNELKTAITVYHYGSVNSHAPDEWLLARQRRAEPALPAGALVAAALHREVGRGVERRALRRRGPAARVAPQRQAAR